REGEWGGGSGVLVVEKGGGELVVNVAGMEGGERERRQLGDRSEHLPHQPAEAWPVRQIVAIGSQIDPGQHDLANATPGQRPRLVDDRLGRRRAAWAAGVGDDAKGAAVVAPLLHLEI